MRRERERETRTPPTHTHTSPSLQPIPVTYRKCVVNQKKLLVGAEQILREVHFEKSRFLVMLRALWICLGRARDLPVDVMIIMIEFVRLCLG